MTTSEPIRLGRKTLGQLVAYLDSTETDARIRQRLFRHGLDARYQGPNKMSRLGNVFYPIAESGDTDEIVNALNVVNEILQEFWNTIQQAKDDPYSVREGQLEFAHIHYEEFCLAIGQDTLGVSGGTITYKPSNSSAILADETLVISGKGLRQRILQFLLGKEHRSSELADLAEISQATGGSKSAVSDQIDILESLGAIKANRVITGDVAPLLTGVGKLMIERESDGAISPRETALPSGATPTNARAVHTLEWDVFICHASEDKDDLVRPLAQKLQSAGLKVWYDEFTLTIGDHLRRKIEDGLINSTYGIVVLSKDFFRKEWPQNELDGLASKERDGKKVILPVWKDVDRDFVESKSPMLSGRLAAKASDGLERVVEGLLRAMG